MKTNDPHAFLKSRSKNFTPKIGLILGSGLNVLADQIQNPLSFSYSEIPGFSDTSVAGHCGVLLLGYLNEIPIACLQGRAHYYEGKSSQAITTPIRTLKLLGCETIILTNAAASLRQEVQPGSLVAINDHINFQFQNPLVGPNDEDFGPRFPTLQNAYDENLLSEVIATASEIGVSLSTGVYLATLGPSYETPAEIRAFKLLGADMVGMSTVPEVIVARHCGLKVIAISTITNMAVGMSDEVLTHESVLRVAKLATQDLSKLLFNVVRKLAPVTVA